MCFRKIAKQWMFLKILKKGIHDFLLEIIALRIFLLGPEKLRCSLVPPVNTYSYIMSRLRAEAVWVETDKDRPCP